MSRFRNEVDFRNQEFEFLINGKECIAKADYTLESKGETPSWDYPGDCETTIEYSSVYDAMTYSDDLDEWIEISVTNEIEQIVLEQIEKHHKL